MLKVSLEIYIIFVNVVNDKMFINDECMYMHECGSRRRGCRGSPLKRVAHELNTRVRIHEHTRIRVHMFT